MLPVPIAKAWKFFSNPLNLEKITPPDMSFSVLTPNLPGKIYSGMMIQYAVTPLLGIKMNWLTEIKHVREPYYFIDEQRAGPYSLWYHEHSFTESGENTWMKDEVFYSLPLAFVGSFAHSLFVRRKIERIFDHREKVIAEDINWNSQ
jgi:ligand-binding SRPBCC domain-containing protein